MGELGVIGMLEIADEGGRSSITIGTTHGGLPRLQLLEEHAYELAFFPATGHDGTRPKFVSPFISSRIQSTLGNGRLPSSRFVGTIRLVVQDGDANEIASTLIEVRPRKLEYLTEFYAMLNDLSKIALDLITTLKSSFTTNLSSDVRLQAESVQQRLLFLRSICEGERMFSAFAAIQALPHTALITKTASQSIAKSAPRAGRLAFGRGKSIPIPVNHPLHKLLTSVPRDIETTISYDTFNTAENRFVKFAVTCLIEFLSEAELILRRRKNTDRDMSEWIDTAKTSFREIASSSMLKGVGQLQMIPIGSPALQRKHGYKQILDVWLKFNGANKLSWDALNDVFSAGQRDAALLYEYWCFFKVRESVVRAFELEDEDLSDVVRLSDDKLTITLKQGQESAISGKFVYSGTTFGLRYHFQSAFSLDAPLRHHQYVRTKASSGTWSKSMEPDFTVAIWAYDADQEDKGEAGARSSNRYAYLHFDAKYRVVLGPSFNEAEAEVTKLRAKSDDLDKMHAYLSAINRSVGSYAIYPGEVTEFFCMSEDTLPSVGYIGIRPGDDGKGIEHLRQHLLNVVSSLHEKWFKQFES